MIQKLPSTMLETHLTDLDQQDFVDKFNRKPFKIGHNLCNHPLFSIQSLFELSQQLPKDSVEYNAGNLPVTQDPNQTPRNGLSIEETIARIENCRSWIVLKNVEKHQAYAELLSQCLAEVKPYSSLASSGMKQEQGFIFISSPGSITPFHIDPENNFLLQVRGKKTVWMFGQDDREVLSEEQIEEFFAGAHRNLEFKESYRRRGQKFELGDGEGLHFPVVAPHYVENGPQVSVSFSITFQTKDSADRQSLHRLNRTMRLFGFTPSGVNQSPWRDFAKLNMLRGLRTTKYIFGL